MNESKAPLHPSHPVLRSLCFSAKVITQLFDKQGAAQWLQLNEVTDRVSDPDHQTHEQFESKGPGQLNKWAALEADPSCFLSKTPIKKRKKQAIWLTYALWKDRPPLNNEFNLFRTLLQEYDVYLAKSGQDLRKAEPIKDADELWRARHKIASLTEAQFRMLAAEQQFSLEDAMILDATGYHARIGHPKGMLDLSQVNLVTEADFACVLSAVDPKTITHICLIAPHAQTLAWLAAHFPQVTNLTIQCASEAWLEEHWSSINLHQQLQTLILDGMASTEKGHTCIHVPKVSPIKCIQTRKLREPLKLTADKTLDYISDSSKPFQLSSSVHEKEAKKNSNAADMIRTMHTPGMVIINSQAEYEALLGSGQAHQTYQIEFDQAVQFTPQMLTELPKHFPHLQSLILNFPKKGDYRLPDMPQLKHLGLITSVTPGWVSLGNYPKLHTFDLFAFSSNSTTPIEFPEVFPALKRARIYASNLAVIKEVNSCLRNAESLELMRHGVFKRLSHADFLELIQNGFTKNSSKEELSIASIADSLSPDAPDGKIGIFSDQGGFSVVLRRRDGIFIPANNYRITAFDEVVYEEKTDQLSFIGTHVRPKALIPLPDVFAKTVTPKPSQDYGLLKGQFLPGKYYPLPSTGPISLEEAKNLHCQIKEIPPGVSVKLFYHAQSEQYFFHIENNSSNQRPVDLTLEYYFSSPASYRDTTSFTPTVPPPKPESALAHELKKRLADYKALAFLWTPEEQCSLQQKLEKLQAFCTHQLDAKKAAPKSSKGENSLDQLLINIGERAGVCRHRSDIFMLLAKEVLGVNVRMVASGSHQWCEVQTSARNWRAIDLGGGETITSYNRQERAAEFLKAHASKPAISMAPVPEIKLPTGQPDHKPSAQQMAYERWIREQLAQRKLFDPAILEEKSSQPQLIRLPRGTSPNAAREAFFHKNRLPKQYQTRYLYIDNPHDFERYVKLWVVREGKRQQMDGPLTELLYTGGLLVVNWSNFSPKEQATYQSLLEQPPRFRGQAIIAKDIRVVGFLDEQLPCPDAFLATSDVTYSPALETKKALLPSEDTDHIDLYQSTAWKEILLGDIAFTKAGLEIAQGKLFKLLENKPLHPCVIHRPPKDPAFWQLLDQIRFERRFFFNGMWHDVPEGFSLFTDLHKMPTPAKAITCHPAFPPREGQKIWLHANNWHTLYEEILYGEEDHLPISSPGKLQRLLEESKSVIFYITEAISPTEWERLADYLLQRGWQDKFTFQWAPGADLTAPIPEHKTLPAHQLSQAFKSIHSRFYTTNDCAYVVERLLQTASTEGHPAPRVIDLTPQMGVPDTLVSITALEGKQEDPSLRFLIQKGALFKALEQGETVILKGEVNPALMRELMPLFGQPPTLDYNGQRIEVKGRVIIVSPEQSHFPVPPLVRPLSCQVSNEDYRQLLSPQNASKEDQAFVDKLLWFKDAANYPHAGKTMPPTFDMSWTRLLAMKKALLAAKEDKHPYRHQHNPLKPLLLNNYLKDSNSEYYQFLNVLSKYLFDENPAHPIRQAKFEALLQQSKQEPQKEEQFAWQLLNTCNGALLRELLGPDAFIIPLQQMHPKDHYLLDYWKLNPNAWKNSLLKLIEKAKTLKQTQEEKIAQPSPLESIPATADLPIDTIAIDKPLASQVLETKSLQDADISTHKTDKITARLRYLVTQPDKPLTVIQGVPGVGKTHFLNLLAEDKKNYSCAVGLNNVGNWLTDKTPGKPKLLLLDEANTAELGSLNFLEGIYRKPPCIYYNHEWHELTPDHHIVVAVNPNYFAGRNPHNLLLQGHVERLEMPDEGYLVAWLAKSYGIDKAQAQQIILCANAFRHYQPLDSYSFRDLQTLMRRYEVLYKEKKNSLDASETPDKNAILYAAYEGEFANRIQDPIKRESFLKDVANILKFSQKESKKTDFHSADSESLPRELLRAHEAIRQALLIRADLLQTPSDEKRLPYKCGLVLQAESGVDTLSLCRTMLADQGLTPANATDKDGKESKEAKTLNENSRYYSVSAGDSQFEQIAIQAFNDDAILLIENLQFLSSHHEKLLGDLLTGKCHEQPAKKPGFLVLGLQTKDPQAGITGLSQALCNRMQILSIPTYSEETLSQFASKTLHDQQKSTELVLAAKNPSTPYVSSINSSVFFSLLRTPGLADVKPMAIPAQSEVFDEKKADKKFQMNPVSPNYFAESPLTSETVSYTRSDIKPSAEQGSDITFKVLFSSEFIAEILTIAGIFSFAKTELGTPLFLDLSAGIVTAIALGIILGLTLAHKYPGSLFCCKTDENLELNSEAIEPNF